MQMRTPHSKVVIVGAGNVGSAFAYALTIKRLVKEIGLINREPAKAEGEAMDLNHGLSFVGPLDIAAGGYELCRDAHIVAITAGASQKPGQSRLDLLKVNAAITSQIVRDVMKVNPSPLILVTTNPVDVLTRVALKDSGLPPNRVIGSGTTLDSSRFRYLLAEHCGVDLRSMHAHVVGEHGDSEVMVWSRVNISGVPFVEYCALCGRPCEPGLKERIERGVRSAAYEIIEKKGATYYAVGLALCRIVEAILRDQKSVLTVSTLADGHYGIGDVCLSMPCVVGADGVERILDAAMTDEETKALQRSAAVLRRSLDEIGY